MSSNSLQLYTLRSLVEMNIQAIPFLWQDYLPTHGFGILTGPSDSNKSTFIRQIAYSIAKRDSVFLGKALNPSKGKVLIIATEDGKTPTAAIVRKQRAHELPVEVQDNVLFHFFAVRDFKQLDDTLSINPVDLVVLDTWTDSYTDDLNSTVKVRNNMQQYSELGERHNCFILGIHHNRKGGEWQGPNKQNVMGSQGIEAYSRVVIDLRPGKENKRHLTVVKGNYVPDSVKFKPTILDLDSETMHLSVATDQSAGYGFDKGRINPLRVDEFKELVINYHKKGYTQDAIVRNLQEAFKDEKTPSKGWVNTLIQEYNAANPEKEKALKEKASHSQSL